ncbi:hypothetical protein [uncultured Methylobacterium sp.]|jgi:hypothetical protein|uniref:hypothetical protein n=1 Tax=uncultured Methylobacterium sp. TaxID=157278 RepID=UPI002620DF6E|nr:hypothetical protein [uncultured Methylobacterium sp.]
MRLLLSFILLLAATAVPRANDLDDMPDLACAQASSDLERQQLKCRETTGSVVFSQGAATSDRAPTRWQSASPLDRQEDD